MNKVIMPLQPIKDFRFVPNRIVDKLLDVAHIDMNDIARMNFTDQERMQFAQLIGYSLSGFADLHYVNDETYDTAEKISNEGISEDKARNESLRYQLNAARNGIRVAASALFKINHEDLEE